MEVYPMQGGRFGGFWERFIGLMKASLEKVLGRPHISLSTLQTLIVEIKAVLNDHPLTYTPSDIDGAQPHTPSHLLQGRKIIRLPHTRIMLMSGRTQLHHRAKTLAHILQCFQSRCKHEYLIALRAPLFYW